MKDSIVIDMKYADYDMIDGSYGVERHHLMGGANRNHADEDGLWVPLSPDHHNSSIETEIAPIVGTKEQAEDLIGYIGQNETSDGIWDTNIFGKTVEQMVQDGITTKIAMIGEESQLKLQDSMQKIVNDTNGGLVCIII